MRQGVYFVCSGCARLKTDYSPLGRERYKEREVAVGDYQGAVLIPRVIAEAMFVISDLVWVE